MVTGLTATSQCLILDKIDPKEMNKEQLGSVGLKFDIFKPFNPLLSLSRPLRRAVWKIPFRLDEIPFFDTSMMCEPAQATHFTSYEEEIEPWDAPLRRRNNVSTHISSHLYHTNRRESNYSEIGSDDGMLVNEPFSRDPNVPMKKMNARKYENSPRPSIACSPPMEDPRSYCSSPTPYSKPNIENLRDKFSSGFSNSDNKSIKKRSAPKPPGERESYDQFERRSSSAMKKAPAPQRPVSPYKAAKSNPIREMETIGRQDVKRWNL